MLRCRHRVSYPLSLAPDVRLTRPFSSRRHDGRLKTLLNRAQSDEKDYRKKQRKLEAEASRAFRALEVQGNHVPQAKRPKNRAAPRTRAARKARQATAPALALKLSPNIEATRLEVVQPTKAQGSSQTTTTPIAEHPVSSDGKVVWESLQDRLQRTAGGLDNLTPSRRQQTRQEGPSAFPNYQTIQEWLELSHDQYIKPAIAKQTAAKKAATRQAANKQAATEQAVTEQAATEQVATKQAATKRAGAKEASTPTEPRTRRSRASSKRDSTRTIETEAVPKKSQNLPSFCPSNIELTPISGVTEEGKIPQLAHGLDRVLFNPGVWHLQDPRSSTYNFDPYLSGIMPNDEFNFDALNQYVTSSKDSKLQELSATHEAKFCGSTSSMSNMLSQFHFLLSKWRTPSFDNLSKQFVPDSLNFTQLTRAPAAAFFREKDGIYSVDADKEYDHENVLSLMGKSMEKLLTLPKDEFEKYRRVRTDGMADQPQPDAENFHYTKLGNFMMRSQLDAFDPRLPGTGMFDLKTRAVVSIRMDVQGFEKGTGYEIRDRFGQWQSFEREYADMIRAAFMKYSLQVRMGRMDGIFVAYHNTKRIFGFQYISLNEMDEAIHGTSDRTLGDLEFKASVKLLDILLQKAMTTYPGRSLRLHVETRPTTEPLTYFFVEPVSDEAISASQAKKQKILDARYAARMDRLKAELSADAEADQTSNGDAAVHDLHGKHVDLEGEKEGGLEETGLSTDEADTSRSALRQRENEAWQDTLSQMPEKASRDEVGGEFFRQSVEDALGEAGLLEDKHDEERARYVDSLVEALFTSWRETEALRATEEEDHLLDGLENSDEGELNVLEEGLDGARPERPSANGEETIDTEDLAPDDRHPVAEQGTSDAEGSTHPSSSEVQETGEQSIEREGEGEGGRATDVVEEQDVTEAEERAVEDAEEDPSVENVEEGRDVEDVEEAQGIETAEEKGVVGDVDKGANGEEKDPKPDAWTASLRNLMLKMSHHKLDSMQEFDGILERLVSQTRASAAKAQQGEENASRPKSDNQATGVNTEDQSDVDEIDIKNDGTVTTRVDKPTDSETSGKDELLGMVLTVRNIYDGEEVERVPRTAHLMEKEWKIKYQISTLSKEKASRIMAQIKGRRKTVFSPNAEKRDSDWYKMYQGKLRKLSEAGAEYRASQTKGGYGKAPRLAWQKEPSSKGPEAPRQ